jgi:hypothetical protein
MDLEVAHSIATHLNKLETLETCIYITINTDDSGMTE